MKINRDGIELIKSREACRLRAYKCPAGVWTIGYGHTGAEVHEGLEITHDEAETLLQSDLIIFDVGVFKVCPIATACQHAAMVSLAYNVGLRNFAKSSIARLHNAERYAEAAQAFALWNKAKGRVLPGLVSRRAEEAHLYLQDISNAHIQLVPNADGEKPLSASRTLNGQVIAAAGAGATAMAPVVKDTVSPIADLQAAVVQLMPYISGLKWVMVGLILFGVGLTLYARWHDRDAGRA